MKKYLYIALAAATLASCSSDDTLDVVQKEAISFGDAFVENATRATDNTYGAKSLDKFNVYGTVTGNSGTVNIYDGDEVLRPSSLTTGTYDENTAWEITEKQYWIAGASYKFAAVVDADNATTTDANAYGMPTKLTYKSSGQKDLLYAEASVASAAASGNGIVKFTFDHLLAKANFTVTNTTNGTNSDYTYTIKDIKITNSITEGVYTISSKTWATTSTGETSFGTISSIGNNKTMTCNTEMLFIPTTGLSITYTVELYNGNTLLNTNTYTASNIEFKAQHAYNFTLNVGLGQEIQFTVTNAPVWTDSDETDTDDYVTVPLTPVQQ